MYSLLYILSIYFYIYFILSLTDNYFNILDGLAFFIKCNFFFLYTLKYHLIINKI